MRLLFNSLPVYQKYFSVRFTDLYIVHHDGIVIRSNKTNRDFAFYTCAKNGELHPINLRVFFDY